MKQKSVNNTPPEITWASDAWWLSPVYQAEANIKAQINIIIGLHRADDNTGSATCWNNYHLKNTNVEKPHLITLVQEEKKSSSKQLIHYGIYNNDGNGIKNCLLQWLINSRIFKNPKEKLKTWKQNDSV